MMTYLTSCLLYACVRKAHVSVSDPSLQNWKDAKEIKNIINHRIKEWFELEGTERSCSSKSPAMGQNIFL